MNLRRNRQSHGLQLPPERSVLESGEELVQLRQRSALRLLQCLNRRHSPGEFALHCDGRKRRWQLANLSLKQIGLARCVCTSLHLGMQGRRAEVILKKGGINDVPLWFNLNFEG